MKVEGVEHGHGELLTLAGAYEVSSRKRRVGTLRDKAAVPDTAGDEAEIAAQHGAAHFALAVVVATAVLRSLGTAVAAEAPAIIGVALGAAAIVLPTVRKPPGYAAAVLAKRRAEYLLPRSSSASAAVTDHRFWITEGSVPANVDLSGNGLVAAVEDGVVIRTGVARDLSGSPLPSAGNCCSWAIRAMNPARRMLKTWTSTTSGTARRRG